MSDVDIVVVCAPGREAEVADSLHEWFGLAGPVALVHEAPQNAPAGGRMTSVLCDTDPLPVCVDWNVWPVVRCTPMDVTVLFDRVPSGPHVEPKVRDRGRGAAGAVGSALPVTLATLLAELPQGRPDSAGGSAERFRLFMAPIILKHAARGWYGSVNGMLSQMGVAAEPIGSLAGAIAQAERILIDLGLPESDVAVRCIRRYMSLMPSISALDEIQPR